MKLNVLFLGLFHQSGFIWLLVCKSFESHMWSRDILNAIFNSGGMLEDVDYLVQ